MDKYEQEMYERLTNGDTLSERELQSLIWEFDEVDRDEGENRRWSRSNFSVIAIGDKFFGLCWEEGLTEMQENEFFDQPYEVEKRTYEKTIMVTEWIKKQ